MCGWIFRVGTCFQQLAAGLSTPENDLSHDLASSDVPVKRPTSGGFPTPFLHLVQKCEDGRGENLQLPSPSNGEDKAIPGMSQCYGITTRCIFCCSKCEHT